MAYTEYTTRYEYENPDEGLIVEMCKSFVTDYCRAIKKGNQEEADKIEYEFRHCYWLKYISNNTDELVTMMLEEGDKKYGKKSKT